MKTIKTQTQPAKLIVTPDQLEQMKSRTNLRRSMNQSNRFVLSRPAWIQYFIDVLALAMVLSFLFVLLNKVN